MLFVTNEIRIPLAELHFDFVRSSGPGGQNVNKVNSKAQLRWNFVRSTSLPEAARVRFLARFGTRVTNAGEVIVMSDRFRDRIRNQEDCLEKLRLLLLEIVPSPKARKKTKPTRASQKKSRESKRRLGDKKRGRTKKSWDQ